MGHVENAEDARNNCIKRIHERMNERYGENGKRNNRKRPIHYSQPIVQHVRFAELVLAVRGQPLAQTVVQAERVALDVSG